MSRSLEEIARIIAATGALSAGIGGVAVGKALAANPRPTPVNIARQIEAQGPLPPYPQAKVRFFADMSKGQQAAVKMKSATKNPKDVYHIGMLVSNPNKDRKLSYLAPVVDISFTKQTDGRWSASQEITRFGKSPTIVKVEEDSQALVRRSTSTIVNGHVVDTVQTEETGKQAANKVLHELENNAVIVVNDITHGQGVSLTKLRPTT